jgi:hypothetical protein
VSPGRGVQRNIVVNHVALVERGRCGPRCAIGDREMTNPKKGKRSFADRIRAAWMSKDADEAEKLAKEAEDADEESEEEKAKREEAEKGKTGDAALAKILDKLNTMDADIQELKKAVAEDDDEDEDEEKKKSREANDTLIAAETAGKLDMGCVYLYTGDAAKQILPNLEILSPGFKLPTMDGKTTDAQRADTLCRCQRKALDLAYQTDAGKAAIDPFLSGLAPTFDTMHPAMLHATFMGASQLMRAKNNDSNSRVSVTTRDFGKPTDVATINKNARDFWAHRSK